VLTDIQDEAPKVAEQWLGIGVITKPAHTTEHDFCSEALHLAALELDTRFSFIGSYPADESTALTYPPNFCSEDWFCYE